MLTHGIMSISRQVLLLTFPTLGRYVVRPRQISRQVQSRQVIWDNLILFWVYGMFLRHHLMLPIVTCCFPLFLFSSMPCYNQWVFYTFQIPFLATQYFSVLHDFFHSIVWCFHLLFDFSCCQGCSCTFPYWSVLIPLSYRVNNSISFLCVSVGSREIVLLSHVHVLR